MMLVIYVGLIGLTYFQFARTPSGFIPPLDRAYFITAFTLPPGSSLERTDGVIRKASEILLKRPGVAHTVTFAGFDGATFTNAPNSGVLFVTLKPFEERVKEKLKTETILDDLRGQMQALREAFVLVIPPPSVPGIGTGGGFKLYVQDRAGRGPRALEQAVNTVIGPANKTPGLVQVFTLFNSSTPQVFADIDRTKAEMLGVPISRFFDTLSTYMGSTFVNDFNILGRTYRVTAQADNPFRLSSRDVEALKTRSTHPATWCRSARSRPCATSPGPIACRATIFFQPPRCRAPRCRASPPARRSPPWKRCGESAVRLRLRMDRDRVSGEAAGNTPASSSACPCCSSTCCWRRIRELAAAARRDPDRADVPAGGHAAA